MISVSAVGLCWDEPLNSDALTLDARPVDVRDEPAIRPYGSSDRGRSALPADFLRCHLERLGGRVQFPGRVCHGLHVVPGDHTLKRVPLRDDVPVQTRTRTLRTRVEGINTPLGRALGQPDGARDNYGHRGAGGEFE